MIGVDAAAHEHDREPLGERRRGGLRRTPGPIQQRQGHRDTRAAEDGPARNRTFEIPRNAVLRNQFAGHFTHLS